jgi:hypothetical protein
MEFIAIVTGLVLNYSPFISWAIALTGVVFWIFWRIHRESIKKRFANSYKWNVIDVILKKIDPSFKYNPDEIQHDSSKASVLTRVLEKIDLFPDVDIIETEDSIKGTIAGNKFQFFELKLNNSDTSVGNNSSGPKWIFKGVFITVTVKNPTPSPLYIFPNSSSWIKDGLVKLSALLHKEADLSDPVDAEFNKLFTAYSDDDRLLANVLKRNVKQKLIRIHEKAAALDKNPESVKIAIVDDSFSIAIGMSEKTNLFEPRLYKPINDLRYIEENVEYLLMLLSFIEELSTNGIL